MSLESFKKCQMYYKRSPNLAKLGFDFNGDFEQEYFKIQNLLVSKYFIQNGSMLTIMKEFKIPSTRTMDILFREFEINSRSLSDATLLSITTGRSNPVQNLNSYVHIWHTTWEKKQVLLRSSLEHKYAKELDEQQTRYDVECMRIKYFDCETNAFRIAIPDFYLPDSNTIVEIKSKYWLNQSNMICKAKGYTELGFGFALHLDGVLIENWHEVVGPEGNAPSFEC